MTQKEARMSARIRRMMAVRIPMVLSMGLLATAVLLTAGGAARAQTIARTGFETSEGYTAGYDVRYETHSDYGWTDAKWGGYKGGGIGNPYTTDPLTVPINDGTAPQGVQHYQQHRADNNTSNTIDIGRRFPEQSGRVYYTFKVRMDTSLTAPPYYQTAADFYVYNAMTIGATSFGGKRAVHFQFLADGTIKIKAASAANDVVVGKWDGTDTLPSARNAWQEVVVDADVATNQYQFIYAGTNLGTFSFRETVSGGTTTLNGIRYLGPRGYPIPPASYDWASGMSLDAIYVGTDVPPPPPPCDSVVTPTAVRTSFAILGQPAAPGTIPYTIANNAGVSHVYTIQEVDAGGTPLAEPGYTWLSLDKTTTTIGPNGSDTVVAAIDATGMEVGTYSAFIKVTDDCDTVTAMIREIQLTVEDCRWAVSDSIIVGACQSPTQHPVTVYNTGAVDISYTVEKIVDCPWLTLDRAGGGPIPPGGSDVIMVTIDTAGLPPGNTSCDLLLIRDCDPSDPTFMLVRTVTASVFTPMMILYNGDVDPDAADSAGPGRTFVIQSGSKMGSVVDDADAYDGKAWRINDTNPASGAREFWRSSPVENLDAQVGSTIVARMKVASESASGAHLRISNDLGASAALHWGGPSGDVTESNRNVTVTVPGDAGYHLFRMSCGREDGTLRTVNIYVDEKPTPVLTIPNAAGIGQSPEGFGFGILGDTGTGDISFDWIAATNGGAFAPGEEEACLGQSLVLVPPCHRPPQDADGDGDVDLSDFSAFAGCFNGPNRPMPADADPNLCRCLDVQKDGDVDLTDFSVFSACFNGPNQGPPQPTCDNANGLGG